MLLLWIRHLSQEAAAAEATEAAVAVSLADVTPFNKVRTTVLHLRPIGGLQHPLGDNICPSSHLVRIRDKITSWIRAV
jgi:hypothetical protein